MNKREKTKIKNEVEQELAAISQRLRAVSSKIQESNKDEDDLEMSSALAQIARAKSNVNEAKIAVNNENFLKRIGKETAASRDNKKSFNFKKADNERVGH